MTYTENRESGFDRKNFIRKLLRDIPVNVILILNSWVGLRATRQSLAILQIRNRLHRRRIH
jgi:hypothetical protein